MTRVAQISKSAVSRVSNPQTFRRLQSLGTEGVLPIGNRRYSTAEPQPKQDYRMKAAKRLKMLKKEFCGSCAFLWPRKSCRLEKGRCVRGSVASSSALRLFLELHDDAVGLPQRASFNMRVHENNVCLAVGLMQPAAVLVADVCLGEINDRRMVQEKRQIGNQKRVGRLADGTHFRSRAIGRLAGGNAGREIRRGVLVHPVADFPRVADARVILVILPMVFQ